MKHSDKKIELQREHRRIRSEIARLLRASSSLSAKLPELVSLRPDLSRVWLSSQNLLFSSRIASMQDVETCALKSLKDAEALQSNLEGLISGKVANAIPQAARESLTRLSQTMATVVPCETAAVRVSAVGDAKAKFIPSVVMAFDGVIDASGRRCNYSLWLARDRMVASTFDGYPTADISKWNTLSKGVNRAQLLDIMAKDGLRTK